MEFVPAALVHADLLAGMHKICFSDCWDAGAMASMLAMPGAAGLIAVDGASLVPAAHPPGPAGLVLWRVAAQEAEILTIAVLPPWRRGGLGHALLDTAMTQAAAAGAEEMFLEVACDNNPALVLYQKAAFRQVGLRKGYYSGKDALVLSRKLITNPICE